MGEDGFLSGLASKVGGWFSSGESLPASAVSGIMNNGGTFNATANTITDALGKTYNLAEDGSLSMDPGVFSKGMNFLNTNSKGIESGTKLLGGLGTWYNQQQMSGLAKQALADQRANTAYNRARQAQGDKTLQEASDRVFGTQLATPYTDAYQGIK